MLMFMRDIAKIIIGLLVEVVILVFSVILLTYSYNIKVNLYLFIALHLTYGFLIANFLKGDILKREYREKAKRELSDIEYMVVSGFRWLFMIGMSICIIFLPIIWSSVIASY